MAGDATYRVVVLGAGLKELASYDVGVALSYELASPIETTPTAEGKWANERTRPHGSGRKKDRPRTQVRGRS